MAKFDIDKRGYDTKQVDTFIDTITLKYEEKLSEQKDRVFALKKENSLLNERLDNFQAKDKQISQALIMAVEKAEQIESSARNIYDLEIRRIRLLYKKWAEILEMINTECPSILTKGKLQVLINEFNGNIDAVIKQNEKFGDGVKADIKKNSDNYIKNLLNRMDYVINEKVGGKRVVSTVDNVEKGLDNNFNKEKSRLVNIEKRFQHISGKLDSKNANVFDNYLNDANDLQENAYSKSLMSAKNSSEGTNGFNMEDILNPKEDLDEIMKAFDFYNDMYESNDPNSKIINDKKDDK